MIKYKAMRPFVYKGKVYKVGDFYEGNQGDIVFLISRHEIMQFYVDGKVLRKPTVKEIIEDKNKKEEKGKSKRKVSKYI